MSEEMFTYGIPVSKQEYDIIEKICSERHLTRTGMIRMLLAEAIDEYNQKCCFGLYVPFGNTEFEKYKQIHFYVTKDMKDFFGKLARSAGGMKEGQVVRQFLIPKLNEWERKSD